MYVGCSFGGSRKTLGRFESHRAVARAGGEAQPLRPQCVASKGQRSQPSSSSPQRLTRRPVCPTPQFTRPGHASALTAWAENEGRLLLRMVGGNHLSAMPAVCLLLRFTTGPARSRLVRHEHKLLIGPATILRFDFMAPHRLRCPCPFILRSIVPGKAERMESEAKGSQPGKAETRHMIQKQSRFSSPRLQLQVQLSPEAPHEIHPAWNCEEST
jgi:hypothetical protein